MGRPGRRAAGSARRAGFAEGHLVRGGRTPARRRERASVRLAVQGPWAPTREATGDGQTSGARGGRPRCPRIFRTLAKPRGARPVRRPHGLSHPTIPPSAGTARQGLWSDGGRKRSVICRCRRSLIARAGRPQSTARVIYLPTALGDDASNPSARSVRARPAARNACPSAFG